jgi:CRP-like cAMP-binding protein
MAVDVSQKVHDHFSQFPHRSYPKGQILVFADESPQHIFYLVKGKVRKYDVSYRGDEVIVNIFKPGAFFPMSWAINDAGNRFFYKTEEATELHLVPVEDALTFLKTNPDVMLDLLSRLYRGMEGVLGRMVQLMSGTAQIRLVYELTVECRRFGEQEQSGGYTLSVSETDLAARSGLTRETVSREMQKLKEKGVIGLNGKVLVVNNLGKLEQLLGSTI